MRTFREYKACADAGLTKAETARRLNVKRGSVSKYAARHGITFSTKSSGKEPDKVELKRPFNPVLSCSPRAIARYMAANP